MRLWRKHRKASAPDPAATKAREQAERDLARIRVESSRVEAMAANWRRIREHNNFAAAIETSMRKPQ